jgi:hypothetical protein
VLITALTVCAAAGAPDPPRTLVYHFQVSARSFGGETENNDLVNSDSQAGVDGRSGRITVAFDQAASDGGVVAEVTEAIDGEARARQTLRCTASGASTSLDCGPDADYTYEEVSLLAFLGPQFYDASRLDAKAHWHASARSATAAVDSDFIVLKSSGSLLTIAIDTKERGMGAQASLRLSESGTMLYDAAAGVPKSVRLESSQVTSNSQADQTTNLDLVSDSMAKTGSRNPH